MVDLVEVIWSIIEDNFIFSILNFGLLIGNLILVKIVLCRVVLVRFLVLCESSFW